MSDSRGEGDERDEQPEYSKMLTNGRYYSTAPLWIKLIYENNSWRLFGDLNLPP